MPDGSWVLSDEEFTLLWNQYNFMKAELAAEKELSKKYLEDSQAKTKVIEGLILDNKKLQEQNFALRNDISEMYTRNDMFVITGGSVLITFMVTFIAVRSIQ